MNINEFHKNIYKYCNYSLYTYKHCNYSKALLTIKTTRPKRPRISIVFVLYKFLRTVKSLGKPSRELYCCRMFRNPGKTLTIVYHMLHNN